MVALPTKLVKDKQTGAEVRINASDYDEARHEDLSGTTEEAAVEAVSRVTSVDQLDSLERAEFAKPRKDRNEKLLAEIDYRRREIAPATRTFAQVVQTSIPGTPEEMVPYMAPASHNRSARSDAEGAVGGVAAPGFNASIDPIENAKTVEELDSLEERIAARRAALEEAADGDGEGDIGDMTVPQAKELIDSADSDDELDALEKAEKSGKGRAGVLDAIEKRRAGLKA